MILFQKLSIRIKNVQLNVDQSMTDTISDVSLYVNRNNLPGLIVSLDQTYDRVEWDFLFKVLETFNFGPKFIEMIKTCYNNIQPLK